MAVENSAAWGGQLELGALAQALRRHIAVYSVGMPRVDMGLEFKGARLTLIGLHHRDVTDDHFMNMDKILRTPMSFWDPETANL